jgi:hypothetical protein
VLGDGFLGLELARPKMAIARELAGRLNAMVRLVGSRPADEPPPSRDPMPCRQRAEYAFRAASGSLAGDQWVAAFPVEDGLPVLRGGSLGFLLHLDATGDDAAGLAWELDAAVAALTYWDGLVRPAADC